MNDLTPFIPVTQFPDQIPGMDFYLQQALKDKTPEEQEGIMRLSAISGIVALFGSIFLVGVVSLVRHFIGL
jgi:hypothetical protein